MVGNGKENGLNYMLDSDTNMVQLPPMLTVVCQCVCSLVLCSLVLCFLYDKCKSCNLFKILVTKYCLSFLNSDWTCNGNETSLCSGELNKLYNWHIDKGGEGV